MKKISKLLLSGLATMMILSACGNNSDNAEKTSDKGSDGYPNKNIEIYCGHGAGGGTDNFAREVAKGLEKKLGVSVNVINQEGAAGVTAGQSVANAPADGYTLIATSSFPVVTAAGTNPNGLDVLQPLARFQYDTYLLWVNPNKYKTFEDFKKAAENSSEPLTIGGTYSLGMDEIATNLFIDASGINAKYIPMDGSGELQSGILGEHLDAILDEYGSSKGLADDGSIVPILVFSDKRLDDYKDVPTSVENGWDITDANERGVMIRKDTPEEIKTKLEETLKEVYDSDEYKEYEANNHLNLREGWLSGKDFEERLEKNIEKYKQVIDKFGSK